MKKLRMILALVAAVGVIVGIVAAAGRADKPASPPGQSKPEPVLVLVTGAITGEGNPYEISLTFAYASFDGLARLYVANPDYPPALKVAGPGKVNRRLTYYYCDGTHEDSGICNVSKHDPGNYKCLAIYDGTENKKTGQVTFPAGSSWRITQKVVSETGDISGTLFAEGTLATPVTYEVLEWGTP